MAILGIYFALEYGYTGGNPGAPLDDVYIHFQFSKNITEMNGFSFNAGEPTPGSTSPAWTLLLSAPYLLIKNHLLIAKLFSVFFYLGIGLTTFSLSKHVTKSTRFSVIAAIMTLITGRLAWSGLSGMEVTLFGFLLSLFLYLYYQKYPRWFLSLILGIGSVVRPEGYLLFVFYLVTEFFILTGNASPKAANDVNTAQRVFNIFRKLTVPLLVYTAIITPYLLFSYHTTGNILPNTFYAQSTAYWTIAEKLKHAALYIFRYGYLILTDNPLAALGLPFGIIYLLKKRKENRTNIFLIVLIVGYPLFSSIVSPNLRHHGRYIIPFIPLHTIVGLYGLYNFLKDPMITLRRFSIHIHLSTYTKYIVLVATTCYLLLSAFVWADTYARNVRDINEMHIYLGNWIKDNTHKDDVIALNDIGAITYISQREIIDTVGLTEPEILTRTSGMTKEQKEPVIWDYITEQKPQYVVILPDWYPDIAGKQELEQIFCRELEQYSIVDGKMCIYKFRN